MNTQKSLLWHRGAKGFSLLLLVGSMLFGGITNAQTPQVNMSRYITLNVTKDSLISIRLATDAANTPIRIVSGDSVYDFTTTSTSLTNAATYYAADTIMTIYGDVKEFYCTNNETKITGIDVSQNVALCTLDCYYNKLTSLNVSGCTALTYLSCYYNKLTSLNVSGCTALTYLSCKVNQLTSLDLSQNVALCTLDGFNNELTSLDVSKNVALCTLYCDDNQLTSIDVSQNTALTYLVLDNNRLTSIDVSQNTTLTNLSCNRNQLTSLDVSNNTALTELSCYRNPFTTAGYDSLMCSLPSRSVSDNASFYPLVNANEMSYATKFAASNSKNAIDKNWNVQYYSDGAAIPSTTGDYECNGGGGEDPTNISEIKLSNIEIYPNPAKTMLNIENATENVQIFDITGRLLINVENKETNLLQINVSNLSKGMYFIKIGNYTSKFVKE